MCPGGTFLTFGEERVGGVDHSPTCSEVAAQLRFVEADGVVPGAASTALVSEPKISLCPSR